jgi:hypothetical protein
MTLRRLLGISLAVAACAAFLPGGAAAAPHTPIPHCNGGDCGGWFKTSVTVTWTIEPGYSSENGCGASGLSEDTAGATFTCVAYYGTASFGNSVTVRKDSSPPQVNGTTSRDPDADGWYTRPVDVRFSGSDGASGVAGCSGGGTYNGPDSAGVTLSGTCTDNAGNSASSSMTIKYDSTAPTVTATPARAPDVNGWYNHPVEVAFAGADGGSGLKECSPKATYSGPDANPAKLVGECRDAAGHVSAPFTVELRYDSTPPARPDVKWSHRGGLVSLAWVAAGDVVRAIVTRAPGRKTKKAAPIYDGKARKFVDRRIAPGTRYWYEVAVFDQAGNRAAQTVGLRPIAGIFAPAEGAVVRRPPVVSWSPVKNARFYNLQLWRGKSKLLTTWVRAPKLALRQRWTFEGRPRKLANGRYKAYVWAALGTRAKPRYGKLLGQVGFVVKHR